MKETSSINAKALLTYAIIFVVMGTLLSLVPTDDSISGMHGIFIAISSLLYTLLVFLSCRLLEAEWQVENICFAATFLLMFLPEASNFMTCDVEAVNEIGSQCIVPFFIGQYHRVSQKDFKKIYTLMLLMGIFCSYTHNGITIPLCAGFLWLSFINRREFFRTACWPMVIGFVIGTSISIWQAYNEGWSNAPSDLHGTISQTAEALRILWDTKIFLIALGMSAYLSISRWGRRLLLENYKNQRLLACCAFFSLCTLPFAPLGFDNALTGVCFFCMYWTLILIKALAYKFYLNKQHV